MNAKDYYDEPDLATLRLEATYYQDENAARKPEPRVFFLCVSFEVFFKKSSQPPLTPWGRWL